ncbi:MAG: IclR family transcriptional regulator [Pigmentiphaga sp.]|uniref:IclR family transcriptional regulator n=1 Tax=Pigmentiphaga sp. TaxID=1977564 RepID=UPI0029A957D6|nr:IclR family transcriptional regulator [Pigmentiphaga sp.]MDX3905149.1 IclR family transcriptional regulator [Pigmentiphaga sp.]
MSDRSDGVAAVERALAILNVFQHSDEALSLHEIANRTQLYKSTILRLLASLIRFRCVQQLADGRYQLGHAVLHWGSVYQASLRLDSIVVPVLTELANRTEEGASFFRREGNVRLCLYRVDSRRSIRDHMHVGDILPLDTGAAGRVLLAFDPSVPKFPESAVIVTIGEREPDIAAVAAPVFGPGRELRGAIAISGPASRFDGEAVERFSRDVRDAAIELTRRLGGDAKLFAGLR